MASQSTTWPVSSQCRTSFLLFPFGSFLGGLPRVLGSFLDELTRLVFLSSCRFPFYSAGSRDSALTVHGVLQTRRLGAHLSALPSLDASSGDAVVITHIFSSDLQRAFATASAILDAQQKRDKKAMGKATEVVKSVDLRERDFRSGEGVRFGASAAGVVDGGRNAFADAESRNEMRVRAERFINVHLDPLLDAGVEDTNKDARCRRAVVVVAHGLILNVLLSSLLQRWDTSELARLLPPAVVGGSEAAQRRRAELRVPWNNTGYLTMAVIKAETTEKKDEKTGDANKRVGGVQLRVTKVNCVEHLDGLKKTRGGIGSARFDPKQKTMDAFFGPSAKRQKRGGDA
jgi:2,3-bisphosphoglycerate-dependent phosphoglycerate mutase